MARRLKLTDPVAEQIGRDIASGLPQHVAAARAGVSPDTLTTWLRRARAIRDGDTNTPCPTCNATGDQPCRTATGKIAKHPHSGRRTNDTPGGDNNLFLRLLRAVERGEADAHARNLGLIQKAAQDGTWQAAAWFLERRYPELYGRTVRTEVSGPQGGPVKLESTGLAEGVSTERLIELARRFNETGDAGDGDD